MDEKSLDTLLRTWMADVQITTWQQLSRQTRISKTRLLQLRRGHIDHLKLGELQQLSHTLQIPLDLLLGKLGVLTQATTPTGEADPNWITFQHTSLQMLESFLTYWPAAAHQAQLNPEFPARKLLPLIKPIERLLAAWDVRQMEPVGATVPFNPQYHQAMTGQIPAGEPVIVRYPGYHQGDKLFLRAQVSRP